MDFFLNDFTQDAQDMIKDNFDFDENKPCATLYFENETKIVPNNKQILNYAEETFGNLSGLAQQYLFYWRREK